MQCSETCGNQGLTSPQYVLYQWVRGGKYTAEKRVGTILDCKETEALRVERFLKTTLLNQPMLSERFADNSILWLMDSFPNAHMASLAVYTYKVSYSHLKSSRKGTQCEKAVMSLLPTHCFHSKTFPKWQNV